MLDSEAKRLREILLAQADVSPLLNLGASDREFREVVQPHIERELFAPLRRAGVSVVHGDLKQRDGVDLTSDVLDPAAMGDLKARKFKCVLIANVLEHVHDRGAFAAACEEIVGPDGLILATVPLSYPYHADPIDSYYRPTPAELAGAFRRSRSILTEELTGRTYAEELRARGSSIWKELALTASSSLLSFARPRRAASRAHRWLWYRRPYRVSIALMAVAEATSPS